MIAVKLAPDEGNPLVNEVLMMQFNVFLFVNRTYFWTNGWVTGDMKSDHAHMVLLLYDWWTHGGGKTMNTRVVLYAFFPNEYGNNSIQFLERFSSRDISNISRILVGNILVDHSDVVTSLFPISHLTSMDWETATARRDENHLSFGIWCVLYWRF